MSLLELTLATALLTTVLTSLSVLVRGSYTAWQGHSSDLVRVESAHGTIRHLLRNIRQAQSVNSITAKTNAVGSLSLLMHDGTSRIWTRNAGTNQVLYGTTTATDLLSEGIQELRFTAYKADGVTETTVLAEIHAIQATAVVHLDRNSNPARTVSCWGWIRSW